MMNYYVALFDCDWLGEPYSRGDIVMAETGAGPPAPWANFDPPPELKGRPQLIQVADDGTGSLIFEYSLEGKKTCFILKARVGLPVAVAAIVADKKAPAGVYVPPVSTGPPPFRFGVGAAVNNCRGWVRWAPRGARPYPKKKEPVDLLHYDDGIDYLRRGL